MKTDSFETAAVEMPDTSNANFYSYGNNIYKIAINNQQRTIDIYKFLESNNTFSLIEKNLKADFDNNQYQSFYIYKNFIYYLAQNAIYRSNIDGKDNKKIIKVNGAIQSFGICNNYLIYSIVNEEGIFISQAKVILD